MNPACGTGKHNKSFISLPVKNLTEIFLELETGALTWAGDRLASLEEFRSADRCVGSIFEAQEPGEGLILQEGLFVLDKDLDVLSFQEFADDLYMDAPGFKDLIRRLETINPGFASAVNSNGLAIKLKNTPDSNKILLDFESGALFDSLPSQWQQWIQYKAPERDSAYEACADWAIMFAAKVFEQIK